MHDPVENVEWYSFSMHDLHLSGEYHSFSMHDECQSTRSALVLRARCPVIRRVPLVLHGWRSSLCKTRFAGARPAGAPENPLPTHRSSSMRSWGDFHWTSDARTSTTRAPCTIAADSSSTTRPPCMTSGQALVNYSLLMQHLVQMDEYHSSIWTRCCMSNE